MPSPRKDLDALLGSWPYRHGEVSARRAHGVDGRPVLQLRIDLGVLQMEVSGRPDGLRPDDMESYLEVLQEQAAEYGPNLQLDAEQCGEVDREFVQYYHRRVAWLALREFDAVVADADHTLALMDLTAAHAPSVEWVEMHEQYRPFVLFHRTQAAALAELQRTDPEAAILAIDEGLRRLERAIADQTTLDALDVDDEEEEDFTGKLHELRRSILAEYELEDSLSDQLADAIAREQYELAAQLRDQIAQRREPKRAPKS